MIDSQVETCYWNHVMDEIFELYTEIVHAMAVAGVVFAEDTFGDLIESLDNGQYYLERNSLGEISTFCNYWMIDDPCAVINGKPERITGGSVIFVVDFFNTGGRRALVRFGEFIRKKEHFHGAAWFHKVRKPGCLRIFKRQRGEQ